MKKETKRNIFLWLFKIAGASVACVLPLWVVLSKFPIWTENYGTGRSLGTGGIVGIVILLIIFRKTVFSFIKERFNLKHTPPVAIWIVLIVVTYVLMFISKFLYDITMVFWMGLIGSVLGTLITFIGETVFGEGGEDKNE